MKLLYKKYTQNGSMQNIQATDIIYIHTKYEKRASHNKSIDCFSSALLVESVRLLDLDPSN